MTTSPMFAPIEAGAGPAFAAWLGMSGGTRTALIALSLVTLVAVAFLAWAIFLRRRRRKRARHPHFWQLEPGESRAAAARRRGRRRRSAHPQRPLNPTLAETGGLPPRRPDDTPPAGI